MLKEFVQAIGNLAVSAGEPKTIADPADPRKAYVTHNGQLREFAVPPPLLTAPVETVASLVEAIETFGGSSTSIWHDRSQIIALLDNTDRLEWVKLRLQQSQQFKALSALPKSFDQRGLVLFLKRVLTGSIDDGLLPIFRQLDFSKREEATGTVKHGDESLGRSIHAKVIGQNDIPEFMAASIRVYANPEMRFTATVRLSVDVDVQRGMIDLTPLPDELENAILSTQECIAALLSELAPETATVFYGAPRFAKDNGDVTT